MRKGIEEQALFYFFTERINKDKFHLLTLEKPGEIYFISMRTYEKQGGDLILRKTKLRQSKDIKRARNKYYREYGFMVNTGYQHVQMVRCAGNVTKVSLNDAIALMNEQCPSLAKP